MEKDQLTHDVGAKAGERQAERRHAEAETERTADYDPNADPLSHGISRVNTHLAGTDIGRTPDDIVPGAYEPETDRRKLEELRAEEQAD